MAWYDDIADIAKATLPTLISTAGSYLNTKAQLDAQKDLAKLQGGIGLESILPLLALGAQFGGGGAAAPVQLAPNYGGTPTSSAALLGMGAVAPRVPLPVSSPIPFSPTTGATTMPTLPAVSTAPYVAPAGTLGTMADWATTPVLNYLFQGGGAAGGAGAIISAPEAFVSTPAGSRARSFFAAQNPSTGRITWFRNAGRPILWSADLRACKRVNRVAARARRASPRRRTSKRR